MTWYKTHPIEPDAPITSAWATAVTDAAQPTFASLAALNTGWPPTEAPEGASAYVLNEAVAYRCLGGVWSRPRRATQGAIAISFPGPYAVPVIPVAASPGFSLAGVGPVAGPATPLGQRVYIVSVRLRVALMTGTNTTLAVHCNAAGTGNDNTSGGFNGGAPEFANHQVIFDMAAPLGWVGATMQGNWTGPLITGGAPDQPLAIRMQFVLANTVNQIAFSDCLITLIDEGPVA